MIDMASLILILAGGALYVAAYVGMRDLRNRPHTEFVRGNTEAFSSLTQYIRLHRLSIAGLALAALGIIVGVSAAVHARQIARRANAQSLG